MGLRPSSRRGGRASGFAAPAFRCRSHGRCAPAARRRVLTTVDCESRDGSTGRRVDAATPQRRRFCELPYQYFAWASQGCSFFMHLPFVVVALAASPAFRCFLCGRIMPSLAPDVKICLALLAALSLYSGWGHVGSASETIRRPAASTRRRGAVPLPDPIADAVTRSQPRRRRDRLIPRSSRTRAAST